VAPTWERFAELMHDAKNEGEEPRSEYDPTEFEAAKKLQLPVLVAKVDCIAQHELCQKMGIEAFPTLVLYTNGGEEIVSTVAAWEDYAVQMPTTSDTFVLHVIREENIEVIAPFLPL